MNLQQIGETAGRVWQALEEQGELRLPLLKKQVQAPDSLLYMALGWLAREDKLELTPEGRSLRVRLR